MSNTINPAEQEKIRAAMELSKRSAPSLAAFMKKLEDLTAYLKNLEQGLIILNHGMQMMNIETNISRLSHSMIYKILIDKNIMAEEEVKAMYQVEVDDKIRKHIEDMQKQAEAEQNPQPEEKMQIPSEGIGDLGTVAPETKLDITTAPVSDVVLPSETSPVIVFNSEGAVDLTK